MTMDAMVVLPGLLKNCEKYDFQLPKCMLGDCVRVCVCASRRQRKDDGKAVVNKGD